MKEENLIHIKFELGEAIESKRDLLSSEAGLLKISKTINCYRSLRLEELKFKLKLLRKIKEIKTKINNLQKILPKGKIPEILKEKEQDELEIKIKKTKATKYDKELESQLQNIQEKLRALGK